jgi:methionine synthase II (cobalamin-independent)
MFCGVACRYREGRRGKCLSPVQRLRRAFADINEVIHQEVSDLLTMGCVYNQIDPCEIAVPVDPAARP